MKTFPRTTFVALALMLSSADALAETASEMAARLDAVQRGSSLVRLRLSVRDSDNEEKASMQVQIKRRRTESSTEVLYQVLFPKERQGESVLLKQSPGGTPSGHRFVLPEQLSPLGASDMGEALFGSDLAYRDVIENFFSWSDQSLDGNEEVSGVNCLILVSKPGDGQQSGYGSVRSWIDPERLVPLRVEKYGTDGKLVRRIDSTRVHKNDAGHYIPATLRVRREGSNTVTELEGSRERGDVSFDETTFTVPKMSDMTPPR